MKKAMQSPRTTRIINTMHHETLGTQVNNGYSESQSKVKANDRVSGYYIPLEILGKTRAHSDIFFLDLGSSISVIKRHRYEQLKGDCHFKVSNPHVNLRSITNGKISVYGQVTIEVKISKYIHKVNVVIARGGISMDDIITRTIAAKTSGALIEPGGQTRRGKAQPLRGGAVPGPTPLPA